MKPPHPQHLEFLKPYQPRIRKLALAARKLVLQHAPGASELLYDAYNAVASGYCYTGRTSDCFIHIVVYSQWVNVGFNRGSLFEDPGKLLQGAGKWIRHIRIKGPADLERPALRAFIRMAEERAVRPDTPLRAGSEVRAVYARKRRP